MMRIIAVTNIMSAKIVRFYKNYTGIQDAKCKNVRK